MDYTNHSKFLYSNVDDIQKAINSSEINANDIVISKDSQEFILIKEDLTLLPIKSRIYRFTDTEKAEAVLNTNLDTYEGQLVAVLSSKGTYEGYIVNKNIEGRFYINPLNVYAGSIDYDTLQHKPIVNITGEIYSPVILDEQRDGIYRVNGSYKLSNSIDTVYASTNNNLFIIEHRDDGSVFIKKIGTDEMCDYLVKDGDVTITVVPTTEWLKEQGYANTEYVDKKLEAMGLITKNEIEQYVSDIVLQTIDATVNERIEIAFNERFEETTSKEIVDLFNE